MEFAGVVITKIRWDEPTSTIGALEEGLFSDEFMMQCRTPSRSTMRESDPKRKASPTLKMIGVLKMHGDIGNQCLTPYLACQLSVFMT